MKSTIQKEYYTVYNILKIHKKINDEYILYRMMRDVQKCLFIYQWYQSKILDQLKLKKLNLQKFSQVFLVTLSTNLCVSGY